MQRSQIVIFQFFLFSSIVIFTNDVLADSRGPQPVEGKVHIGHEDITLRLQRYPLHSKQRIALSARSKEKMLVSNFSATQEKKEKQLGMNNVPVFNQGGYGSCVTFSNIAAIDALLPPEDYISPWCNLTLGQYLEEHSKYYQSGWNGSFGEMVLNQMYYYGVIPQSQEGLIRCGGADSYLSAGATKAQMSLAEYSQYSQPLENIAWVPVLSYVDGFYFKTKEMSIILNQVRETLLMGDRMTLGFLIDTNLSSFIGAEGRRHVSQDTWVMTPEIKKHISEGRVDAGHEIIITGFDDQAVVYDQAGEAHHGLLTLRNSWGEGAGHHGDYYMTYDYFLLMAVEVQRIFNTHAQI